MTFKEILKDKNITQSELASRVGLSQQSISAWCNGTAPKIRHIGVVAQALDVSVEDILRCFEVGK